METEIFQKILAGIGLAATASAIRALLTANETLMQKVRTFIAGVFMGALLSYILRHSVLSQFWKDILISTSAAFISQIWPVIERFTLRYLNKKGNELLADNNNSKPRHRSTNPKRSSGHDEEL